MAQKFELQLIFTIDEHTLSKKSNVQTSQSRSLKMAKISSRLGIRA